jgi:hypothetical protein
MSDDTARLKLPHLVSLQELNAVTWNEALEQIDALVDLHLLGQFVNTPPASPQDGDAYLIGGAPTGAWTGYAYKIASCRDGAWRFYQPFNGLSAFVAGTVIVYVNGVWQPVGSTDFATRSGSETLTGKTLSNAALSGTTGLPGGSAISASGWIGIGKTPVHALDVVRTDVTSNAFVQAGASVVYTATPGGLTGTNFVIAGYYAATLNGPVTSGSTYLRGLQGTATLNATATGALAETLGLTFAIYNYQPAGSSVVNVCGTDVWYNHRGGGSLTNLFGFRWIGALSGGTGTIANSYGLYLDTSALDSCIASNYGVYQAGGNARNYFAGRVGLGTSSPLAGCALDAAGHVFPHAANSYNLGSSSYYWANGYIQNAWTVVSDETLKDDIAGLTEAEMAVAKRIASLIATYKMKTAVAEKGPLARKHCGWIAQRIEEVFADHGLDPFAYGCVGFDPATKTVTRVRSVTRPKMDGPDAVIDADGTPVMETVDEAYDEEVPDCDESGAQRTIHNLRLEEVTAFALAGLAARVAALEAERGDDD